MMLNRLPNVPNGLKSREGMSAVLTALVVMTGTARALAEDGLPAPQSLKPAVAVPGSLFICGGGKIPEPVMTRFVEVAGGSKAHIAVITTASETADSEEVEPRIANWRLQKIETLSILHTRSREVADDPRFYHCLDQATGVWFIGGNQSRVTEAYLGTKTEARIRNVLERGGAVGGTSAGAAIMTPVMIRGGQTTAEVGTGFGFLSGAIVDQHFVKRRRHDRLMGVLARYPNMIGLGIDEGTAVVVQGRKITVLGDSTVTACLGETTEKPARTQILESGAEADLVALSRAAFARVSPRQERHDGAPEVAKGTLVLAGGGEVPSDAARRFIDAAGGEDAEIVVITTAMGDQPPSEAEATEWLTAAGAKRVRRVHASTPKEAESPELHEMLKRAKGVWFAGGRQWRLVDAFLNTTAEKLFHDVLARGGAIGGTAAGASIQAGYLVRGNPMSNKEIMGEGYEEGFGFLPGVAVDQFFSQRKRFDDMSELKKTHPKLIGLGVDEKTALVVQGHVLEVIGENRVAVYDRSRPAAEGEAEFEMLQSGDEYDLKERRRLGPPRTEPVSLNKSSSDEDDEGSEEPRPQPALVCE